MAAEADGGPLAALGAPLPAAPDRVDLRATGAALPRADLRALLRQFVRAHAGWARQRTPEWLARKSRSIGGSEMASLMGWDPYKDFDTVVAMKAGVRSFSGGVACWWGTMFEPVIERYVEIDCGTRLAGTDISVPAPESSGLRDRHANSPDGYGVVTLFQAPEGDWKIRFSDAAARAEAAGKLQREAIALFEFKCPYGRWPRGAIPKHYKPQLWSGLALSPVAHFGLFVDAVFRKCALWNLGAGPGFDWAYHRGRKNPRWTTAIAWGLTAVYSPRLDADAAAGAGGAAEPTDMADAIDGLLQDAAAETQRAEAAISPADAAHTAWKLHCTEFGISYESAPEAARAGRPFLPDAIDFGDCRRETFETAMRLIDRGAYPTEHVGPCFADGRGEPLGPRELDATVARLQTSAPPGCYLLGLIPWKMLEVSYVPLERRPGFLAEVAPLVHRCLDAAEALRAAEDPAREFHTRISERRQAALKKDTGLQAAIQDLFDEL